MQWHAELFGHVLLRRHPAQSPYLKKDNKQGSLIIESPFLFSFGVSERKDIKSDELTGYCLSICFWEKNSNPKPEEFECYEAIKK